MKLAKLPEAFCFQELKKGFFPHMFNKKENFSYIGPYPAQEFYSPDYMSSEDKSDFLSWYQEKVDSDEQFKF